MNQDKKNIYIGVARVKHCLNEHGVNKNQYTSITTVDQSINDLKKKGAEKPVFTGICPKKPTDKDSQDVKELYTKSREQYELVRKEYEVKLRQYESFSSMEYKRASLAHKLTKKLAKLVALKEEVALKPSESKSQEITRIQESLKGGLKKPIIGESVVDGKKKRNITGQEITLHFTELCGGDIPEDVESLKNLLAKVSFEFKNTNDLFTSKDNVKNTCLKIDKSVTHAVTYVVQEAVCDLMTLAIKNCKLDKKSTVSVENFSEDVLRASDYFTLFSNLNCVGVLRDYLKRKNEYDLEMKTKTLKEKKNMKNFIEREKSQGFMSETKGEKFWKGLNLCESEDNFVTYVGHIFDTAKSLAKKGNNFKISRRAKEYMSNMIIEFLSKLANKFEIYKTHKCKLSPRIKNTNGEVKERKGERTLKLSTAIMIFDILLDRSDDKLIAEASTIYVPKTEKKN